MLVPLLRCIAMTKRVRFLRDLMEEPADDSKKVLPLLAVSAVVVMLLGGFIGVVKRTTVPNDALTTQQFFVEGYIKEQRHAPAVITPRPEQQRDREFVGQDSSRRVE